MSDRDPAVSTWGDALNAQLSTSAQLRQLEEALEGLQVAYNAELAVRVAAERERDEALAENEKLREPWKGSVVDMLRENERIRAQVIRERNAERDELRAQVGRLRAELAGFGYAG